VPEAIQQITSMYINEIVSDRRGITADTALRLARFFGTDVQSWMNLQQHKRQTNS
jgi:antitoxin HigA-1